MIEWVHKGDLYEMCERLIFAGHTYEFVEEAKAAALEFEGVYDLMTMWDNEDEREERRKIISDIRILLYDIGRGYELQASKKEQEAEKSDSSQQADK